MIWLVASCHQKILVKMLRGGGFWSCFIFTLLYTKKIIRDLAKVAILRAGTSLRARDDEVKVHYTGKLDDGTVFDSSKERSMQTTHWPDKH